MALIGYARVSSASQSLDLQIEVLKAAGCDIVRSEKISGTSRVGREELASVMEFIRAGDVLVVTRIDRLARSVKDLQDIVATLKERGAALKATEQPVDTSTAAGKAFTDMLAVFAEFETSLRKERQLEGIAAAKERGVYKGATSRADGVEIRRLHFEDRLGPAAIAKKLKIGRATVYRHLQQKA